MSLVAAHFTTWLPRGVLCANVRLALVKIRVTTTEGRVVIVSGGMCDTQETWHRYLF